MKRIEVAALLLFFLFSSILCGCTSTLPKDNETNGPTDEKFYDTRLIGAWKNPRTLETLEFGADGIYWISEAETEHWYTLPGGILWMYGTNYTYSFSQNDTLLSITEPGFTRTWNRI